MRKANARAKFTLPSSTLWSVGYCCGWEEDRTEKAVRPYFTKEMGRRRCHTLRVVCMDMWAPNANLVQEYATKAQFLSDRSHIVKHINEAAEKVRRELWRQLTAKERTTFTNTQMLRSHLNGIPP